MTVLFANRCMIPPISFEDWRLLTLGFYAKFIAIADLL